MIDQTGGLVAIVRRYIKLHRVGKEMVGLCPFHRDRNPSLNVNPQNQLWICRSCGAGGDAFSFLMMIEGISFPEAKRLLGADSNQDPETGIAFNSEEADFWHKRVIQTLEAEIARIAADGIAQLDSPAEWWHYDRKISILLNITLADYRTMSWMELRNAYIRWRDHSPAYELTRLRREMRDRDEFAYTIVAMLAVAQQKLGRHAP